MYATMLLTIVSFGKQASVTIIQFTQKSLAMYGLHNFNLDVRKIFVPMMQRGVNQEKHTNLKSLCFDMIEWYSSGRHIATYLSYAITARKASSLQAKEYMTKA